MPSPNAPPEPSGVLDHLKKASSHALRALRYYVALATADLDQRVQSAVRRALWPIALVALGLIGAGLVASGLAARLEAWLGPQWPGCGRMLIGAAILAAVLVAWRVQRRNVRK